MPMIAALFTSGLLLASGEPAPAPQPLELAPVALPASVQDALGVSGASALRQVGIASLATGVLLEVVAAGAFAVGFEVERVLRAEPHPRGAVDALLWQRTGAAAVAYPSLVLGTAGIAAGVTCLLLDETRGGLSDGHEEVAR